MTDIFLGLIDFVSSNVSELPSIESKLPVIGHIINCVGMILTLLPLLIF